MEISVSPKSVLRFMLSIIILLSALHIGQLVIYFQMANPDVFDFIRLLDFDYEANLPSLYSHMALLFAALLLFLIALKKPETTGRPYGRHWLFLAVIFTFLAVDEAVALHEGIGQLFEDKRWVDASGFFYFAWVVPYGVLLCLLALTYFRFLLALPKETQILFVLAGVFFISGAVGFEMLSAKEADRHGLETILYSALYTIEEILEMCGVALFCYALLRYIERQNGYIHFRIG